MASTRHPWRTIGRWITVCVLAVATACGGNDNGGDTASGRAIEPEAQQRAESINLRLADFPDGWRVAAPESDDDTGREVFAECISVDDSGLTRIGDAKSQDFFEQAPSGSATQASSAVVIFDDEQQAEDAMSKYSEDFGGSTAEDCFQDANERVVRAEGNDPPEGFKFGEVDIGELSFTPPDVDEAQAWQIVMPLESLSGVGEGPEVNFYLELVLLREGDTTARLLTQEVETKFDRELLDKLAETIAGRMSESAK